MNFAIRSEIWLAAYMAALAGGRDGNGAFRIADQALADFATRFPGIDEKMSD